MTKKYFILLLALAFCFNSGSGQVLTTSGNYMWVSSANPLPPELNTVIDGISTMHFTMPDKKVNGSPFLHAEFMYGIMTTSDNVTIDGLRYRYNIYNDEMQFILKGDTASIIRPLTLKEIWFGEVKFIYDVYYTADGTAAACYFEVLEDDKLSVLLRRTKELEYDEYIPNYGGGGGSKEYIFKEKEKLYLKFSNGLARNIRNKKDFLNLLPDHEHEVKDYMISEKLSVRKQKDLKELARYYNSLESD